MAPRLRYDTVVTEVGEHAGEFFDEGILVLFGEDAPPELREHAVVQRPERAEGGVEPGDEVRVDGEAMRVLAVGEVANDNLASLGHLVLKRNGAAEPALPGDVCCDQGPVPRPAPGSVIRIAGDTEGDPP